MPSPKFEVPFTVSSINSMEFIIITINSMEITTAIDKNVRILLFFKKFKFIFIFKMKIPGRLN